MKSSLILLPLLCACNVNMGEGTTHGKIVDVQWSGLIFDTCEVDVQYGQGSSRIDENSTKDKSMCDKLESMIGKEASIKYRKLGFIVFPYSRDRKSVV